MRRYRIIVTGIVLGLLAACGDDGAPPTEPEIQISLEPGSARPFEMVVVKGPPRMDWVDSAEIRVGGVEARLRFDTTTTAWTFMVPTGLSAGAAPVEIVSRDGRQTLSATLIVQEPELVGGSAEATVHRLEAVSDSLAAIGALLRERLDPERDTVAIRALTALVDLAHFAREQIDSLDAEETEQFAAFYAANREFYEAIFSEAIAALVRGRRAAPTLGFGVQRSPGTLAAGNDLPVPISEVVDDCIDGVQTVQKVEAQQALLETFESTLGLAMWIAGPQVKAGFTAFTLFATGVLELRMNLLRADPFLIVPGSLVFTASPSSVKAGGEAGFMEAYISRQSIGYTLRDAKNAYDLGSESLDLIDRFKEEAERIEESRGSLVTYLRDLVQDEFFSTVFDRAFESLAEIAAAHDVVFLRRSGEVMITHEGFEFLPDADWWFVHAATLHRRGFRAAVTAPNRTVEVDAVLAEDLEALVSSAELASCRVSMDPAGRDASIGRNAFSIVAASSESPAAPLFADSALTMTVRQGTWDYGYLSVENRGDAAIDSLRVEFGSLVQGEWQPWDDAPSGVSIYAAPYFDSLAPGETNFVYLEVEADVNAAKGSFVVPISIRRGSRVLTTSRLTVTVESQLSDVTVIRKESTMFLWDDGNLEDGDSIRIELNGRVVVDAHSLTANGTEIPLTYVEGDNLVRITALNEGYSSPNTAAIAIRDVTSGQAEQSYRLYTGQTVSIVIRYDPTATTDPTVASPSPARTGSRRSLVREGAAATGFPVTKVSGPSPRRR